MTKTTNDFYDFFEECIKGEKIRPAEEGERDPQLVGLINSIIGKTDDFVLVDYGCGKGRFVKTLNNLNRPNTKVLDHMHYIGVDKNKDYLLECEKLAEDIKFKQRVKRFELKGPVQFYNYVLPIDHVFLINTLHEISPLEVDITLQDLLFKLKYKGSMIIHELKQLLLGEKEFITFEEEDILFLFKDIKGITCNIFQFRSKRRQIEMYNAYIIKTTPEFVSSVDYDLEYTFFELLKKKRIQLIKEIDKFENKNSRSYAYLIALYTNVSKAIIKLEANQNIWSGGEVRCWTCGSIVTVERSGLDTDLDGYEAVVTCPGCGLREKLFRYRAHAWDHFRDYKMLWKYYPEEFKKI